MIGIIVRGVERWPRLAADSSMGGTDSAFRAGVGALRGRRSNQRRYSTRDGPTRARSVTKTHAPRAESAFDTSAAQATAVDAGLQYVSDGSPGIRRLGSRTPFRYVD